MVERLDTHIESLIFVAQQPVKREDIKYNLENALQVTIDEASVDDALHRLQEKYWDDNFAIEIVEVAEGFQFVTKGAYHHIAGSYLKQLTKRRLSKVALETLAIIAYKQPVSRAELEQIRGVNSDYAIDKLLEKEMIEIAGRSSGPGKPLLYKTSGKFMDYFGLRSIEDLPQLKEFQVPVEEIGEPSALEEVVSFELPVQENDGHAQLLPADESE
ncbi:MAG: SMC-Scp complex subunit ScpB [Saprospiraceae bacterium]|nr:SMC-Scp complex subunit ScpB [Candidatus Opimibacter iunctus]